ncbi:MAG: oxidoreductase [Porticoccaceae bacterium]|jgi:NAD(P)-dependent dehydrogenase (short-subunit alcohol dehydrogenase family)
MTNDLNGKVWCITGASTGLGRAISEHVIRRGGFLLATARDPATLRDLVDISPDRTAVAKLDVTSNDDITTAIAFAKNRFGRIDVLVNNAGYGFIGAVEEASDDEIHHQFDVNFFGLVSMTKAVLPLMRAQRSGTIINLSSIAGVRGGSGGGYYSATKWAVEGLSEALAAEGEPLGIRVLIVEPGPFRTDFANRSLAFAQQQISDYQTVAETRQYLANMDGCQEGDPHRAADIIIDTATQPNPPRRLVLGRTTYTAACKALQSRLQDSQRSEPVAALADYPKQEQSP